MKHQNQLPATSYQLPATSLKSILKPVFNLLFFGMLSYSGYAQTNTLPPSGNVGIGTTKPSSALQVNGTARIELNPKFLMVLGKPLGKLQKWTNNLS